MWSISTRKLERLELPPSASRLRLQLRRHGQPIGKVDMERPAGLPWSPLATRWVREEAMPRVLPRHLRRRAWREPQLALRLLRLLGSRPGRRYLWHLLHTPVADWRRVLVAFLVAHHRSILGELDRVSEAAGEARPVWDRARWESLFAAPDPWGYGSSYEQTKYRHTLELLPEGGIGRALELACAEGHFTVQLAPRVGHLLAADIADAALARAAERCAGLTNVAFRRLDMRRDELPSGFDLIVCSEVLYYIGNGAELARFAGRLARAVLPGGYLLLAHANAVVDNPDATGFDWPVGFAAEHIGAVFAGRRELEFVRELRTPVYRIQLYQRRERTGPRTPRPREVVERSTGDLAALAASINWGGCVVTRRDAAHAWVTRALPILMYHRIASDGPSGLAPYRVSRDRFERQLAYLRRHGYRTISLAQWHDARHRRDGIVDDRVVLLTFDDGYRDFLTDAWPLLRAFGFGATLFVATDWVGGRAEWDRSFGEPAELLGWDELRCLAAAGVEIGAHSRSHPWLTRLPADRIVAEGLESRQRLESELGRPVTFMAYPYGDENLLVRRAMAGCGYAAALSTRPGLTRLADNPMSMPRQLIAGDDDLDAFVAKLGRPTRATLDRRLLYAYQRRTRTNLI